MTMRALKSSGRNRAQASGGAGKVYGVAWRGGTGDPHTAVCWEGMCLGGGGMFWAFILGPCSVSVLPGSHCPSITESMLGARGGVRGVTHVPFATQHLWDLKPQTHTKSLFWTFQSCGQHSCSLWFLENAPWRVNELSHEFCWAREIGASQKCTLCLISSVPSHSGREVCGRSVCVCACVHACVCMRERDREGKGKEGVMSAREIEIETEKLMASALHWKEGESYPWAKGTGVSLLASSGRVNDISSLD